MGEKFSTSRHRMTCRCGAEFVTTGLKTQYCPLCRAALKRIHGRYDYYRKSHKVTREEYEAGIEREYQAYLKGNRDSAHPDPVTERVCPFCGKRFVGTKTYCANCITSGMYHVHEETGRTNGWDTRTRTRVHAVGGWRGRPVAGGGGGCITILRTHFQ